MFHSDIMPLPAWSDDISTLFLVVINLYEAVTYSSSTTFFLISSYDT